MGPLPRPVNEKHQDSIVGPPKGEPFYDQSAEPLEMVNGIEKEYKKDNNDQRASRKSSTSSENPFNGVGGLNSSSERRKNLQNSNGLKPKSKEAPESHDSSSSQDDSSDHYRDQLIDTIPFGADGIQTVIKSQLKKGTNAKSFEVCLEELSVEAEIQRLKEENSQIKKALNEAAFVNQQWRDFSDQRQNFVHHLQDTINELRKETSQKQEGTTTTAELQKLKDTLAQQQKEHLERTQLLQAQIRIQKEDWEAERCEKQIAEAGRIQAEKQVDMLQKILHHLMAKMAILEEHQKLCRCCCQNFTNGFEENMQVASYLAKERQHGVSPNKTSPLSSESHSRSSSMSIECSNPTSPIFSRNLLCVSQCRRSSSPSSKTSSPGPPCCSSNQISCNESFESPYAAHNEAQENQNQVQSKETSNNEKNKNAHITSQNNSSGTETPNTGKGVKSKNLPKLNCHTGWSVEADAKHRARSILASALPTSPSSKKPPSPFAQTSSKSLNSNDGSNGSQNKFRAPFVAHKRPKSVSSSQLAKVDAPKLSNNSEDASAAKSQTSLNEAEDTSINKVKENKLKEKSTKKQSQKLNEDVKDETNESNNEGRSNVEDFTSAIETVIEKGRCVDEINDKENARNCSKESNVKVKESSPSKSETNIQLDDYGNNESNSEINSSYTSIAVMPNSSTIQPPSQVTSTNSSRSSSPGISLMTFALNAEGQGVPGAILFAIGSDSKSPKTVQSLSVTTASNAVETKGQQSRDKSPGLTLTAEFAPSQNDGKLVNSTWVKLMDKESNPSKSSNGMPWRTARAVPSHQLNTSRKISCENSSNSESYSNISRERSPSSSYIQTRSVQTSPDSCGHVLNNTNEQNSCSTYSYSVSGEVNSFHRELPTIICPPCIHASPHSKETSPNSGNEMDLKSLASRNITSAILSHECSNKKPKASHSKTSKSQTRHKSQKKTYIGGVSPEVCASMHCVICPRCQMIFHEEQMHSYSRHIQLCAGPKYIDM